MTSMRKRKEKLQLPVRVMKKLIKCIVEFPDVKGKETFDPITAFPFNKGSIPYKE